MITRFKVDRTIKSGCSSDLFVWHFKLTFNRLVFPEDEPVSLLANIFFYDSLVGMFLDQNATTGN
jgi:hypothetical protein